jgi:transcriptional regulator with GAF, ATPase, and Fis domain
MDAPDSRFPVDLDECALLRRLDRLAELLPALGSSLDVREVFGRISEITRAVLPHDAIGLALLTEDRQHVRLYAVSTDVDFARPDIVRIPEPGLADRPWDHLIIDDAQDTREWQHLPPVKAGFRSSLRVPIRMAGRMTGGLNFLSRTPRAFTEAQVPIAQRVAAYVCLALSHQRLAEEAARAAEARERAARLERRVRVLHAEVESLGGADRRMAGHSPAWKHVLAEASRVAPTDTTVLLTGASGTGKEVVARFIHRASLRVSGPFVALNGAALPESLLESELFGYERGAFTGATQAKPGRVEQAAGGVLFLDEVGEMSPRLQAKLLRLLEEREFQRLGGTRTLRADIRVLAATNRDLRQMVARGDFREDLFYRLNVFEIRLPPLRERREDILPLCEALLEEIGRALGRPAAGLSREAPPLLLAYAWPGNVRELRNVLERASILADGGLITSDHLTVLESPPRAAALQAGTAAPLETAAPSPAVPGSAAPGVASPAAVSELRDIERNMIIEALRASRYNKTRAAKRLGLTRAQLYVRLRRHKLHIDD